MKESEPEVLKIEESESDLLCTDSTALVWVYNRMQDVPRTKQHVIYRYV
jgi:hypothetical protein